MSAKRLPLQIEPRFRISHGRNPDFGPGKADLLEHIAKTGSIADAAKAMAMSYMRAWKLVKSMDRGFAEPLVIKVRGGSSRGGAELTATGREVLRLYRTLEAHVAPAVAEAQRGLMGLLARRGSASGREEP